MGEENAVRARKACAAAIERLIDAYLACPHSFVGPRGSRREDVVHYAYKEDS